MKRKSIAERADICAQRWIPEWTDDRDIKVLYARAAYIHGYEAAKRDAQRKRAVKRKKR